MNPLLVGVLLSNIVGLYFAVYIHDEVTVIVG